MVQMEGLEPKKPKKPCQSCLGKEGIGWEVYPPKDSKRLEVDWSF